jgi:hypothetical protein
VEVVDETVKEHLVKDQDLLVDLAVEVVEEVVPLTQEQVEQQQHVKVMQEELEQIQVVAEVAVAELTLLEPTLLAQIVVKQVEQVEQEKILVLYFQDHQIVEFMLEVVEVAQVLRQHQELLQLEEQVVVEHLNQELQHLQHQEQLILEVVEVELVVEIQETQELVAQE